MSTPKRLLVTGASGFLGRAIVAAARKKGMAVSALIRSEDGLDNALNTWRDDPGITLHRVDLGDAAAETALAPLLQDVSAVIHTAARMRGTDQDHARDTVEATAALIRAINLHNASIALEDRCRLVVVSSFSVYGYAALPDHATLDEHTPVEPDPVRRDPYCRAKLAQEKLARRGAQENGLAVRIMRVGTLYGPGHLWSARLGFRLKGLLLCPHGSAPVPAIHVDDCARAVVQAACNAPGATDLPMTGGAGPLDIINLVSPNPPTQREWLKAVNLSPAVRLPLGPLLRVARLLDLCADLFPFVDRHLPGAFREATLAARFKPLSFSCARAEDRLGFEPSRAFSEAIAADKSAKAEPST